MKRCFATVFGSCVVLSLAAGQEPADIQALIKQLKDKDAFVRLRAAKTLGQMGEKAKEAVPALKEALADPDEDVQAFAKRALELIGPDAQLDPKVSALIKDLRNKDVAKRVAALVSLGKMGKAAKAADVAIVESMIVSPNFYRDTHLDVFGKVHPELAQHVVTFMVDKTPENQTQALKAIMALKTNGKAALPLLILFCAADTQNKFANSVTHIWAIRAAATVAPEDARTGKLLSDTLLFKAPADKTAIAGGIRSTAIEVASKAKIPAQHIVPALIASLNDKSNLAAAVAALGNYGPDAKAALPALARLKFDENALVREAVSKALEKIDK